jgi:hypothetical protein
MIVIIGVPELSNVGKKSLWAAVLAGFTRTSIVTGRLSFGGIGLDSLCRGKYHTFSCIFILHARLAKPVVLTIR